MNQCHCPLCSSSKFAILSQYQTRKLADLWIQNYGFDPFLEVPNLNLINKIKCAECDLIFYHPSFSGDDKFYETLSNLLDFYYESERWEFDQAINLIFQYQPSSLLEIGCGSGAFLEKIKFSVDYTEGIEINPNAIKICKQKGLNVTNSNLKNIHRKYEMIVLFEVLEHLDNINEILNYVVEKLEDNGFLLIAVPNPDGYLKDCGIVLLDLPPHHNLSISEKVFDYIGKTYDFKKIYYATEPIRYVHYFSYLLSLYNLNSTKNNPLKKKIDLVLISIFSKMLAPLFFPIIQPMLTGQTHLALFKKL